MLGDEGSGGIVGLVGFWGGRGDKGGNGMGGGNVAGFGGGGKVLQTTAKASLIRHSGVTALAALLFAVVFWLIL